MRTSVSIGHLPNRCGVGGCHGRSRPPWARARRRSGRQTARMVDVERGSGPAPEDIVGGWIAVAERVTVLTGAGISTDSGIPDFRGPQGVWTKNPAAEKTSTLQHYLADPDVRRQAWRTRAES